MLQQREALQLEQKTIAVHQEQKATVARQEAGAHHHAVPTLHHIEAQAHRAAQVVAIHLEDPAGHQARQVAAHEAAAVAADTVAVVADRTFLFISYLFTFLSKIMKRVILISIISLLTINSYAQYASDALRFSQQYYQGTARNMAVGSAFGALGSDLSTLATNPAGLGLFRNNEYTVTPEVFTSNISSLYHGNGAEDTRTVFDLSNFGMVTTTKAARNAGGFKFFQFAFGLNRLNNYNSNRTIAGNNTASSKLDVYLENADGIDYQDIENDYNGYYSYDLTPAWNTYLIDTIPGYNDWYYSPVPFAGVQQKEIIASRGSTNEWDISMGTNFDDKLYFGITFGLPYTRYFRETRYSEQDIADTIPYFNSWSSYENLTTTGFGFNIKAGLIYRPIDWLRIGGAYHSPTWYAMTDHWYTRMNSDLEDGYVFQSASPDGAFDYKLHTPMRAIGDVAIIFRKYGFLTFEYEYVDYSTAKFKANGVDYATGTNADIRNYYQATHNFRGGVEIKAGVFSFRGGYALYASPYKQNLNDGKKQYVTGGLGYNNGSFGIDFAFVYGNKKSDYYLYTSNNFITEPAKINEKDYQAVLTLSYRY